MSLVLTDRDIRIFRYLNEQKYMTLDQIQNIFWPEKSLRAGAAGRRMRRFIQAGYVKMIKPRDRDIILFLLTDEGIEILGKMNLDHGLSEIRRVDPLFMQHTLKLVNIRALFEELGQKNWTSERLLRRGCRYGCFPDAVLSVAGLKIAIEFENSIRETRRYADRFRYYDTDNEFKLVIYITSQPMRRLFKIEHPQDKICFVKYEDLFEKKSDADLQNWSSSIKLGSILSEKRK